MTGRIPSSFIDELLARADIVDVIDSRVQLKKTGHEYQACCPFHNEKTPSFTVSPDKQFYHCFGCGAHGSALGFLMEYEHMTFVEAVEELASGVGLEVPREKGKGGERMRGTIVHVVPVMQCPKCEKVTLGGDRRLGRDHLYEAFFWKCECGWKGFGGYKK